MSPMMRVNWVIAAVLFTVSMTGCLEPDREGYRDQAAAEYCEEADRCGNIGDGESYDTFSDCEIDARDTFNDLWPASECDEGRINADAFDTCMNRAVNQACSQSFGDAWSFAEHCSADEVCID